MVGVNVAIRVFPVFQSRVPSVPSFGSVPVLFFLPVV